MEAERRRAGREVERREGERRLVDRDDATGNDTADGRDDDTEGVRSGGESDAETRPGRTAYPPLGWTQRDLDQQEAARRSRRNEREMRREGRQLSGDEEGVVCALLAATRALGGQMTMWQIKSDDLPQILLSSTTTMNQGTYGIANLKNPPVNIQTREALSRSEEMTEADVVEIQLPRALVQISEMLRI
ncbi:hypothetical protein RHS01_04584 [Rhizoctonia solani]|uniref:Uncharacterized protein n=1 Tax=Rhizoctonia solani TaxID=456999 RepID=A0A8H7M7V3_9AGAM|nr:hypothetical protein RHS01_04584 [Rhizoctonia solani]